MSDVMECRKLPTENDRRPGEQVDGSGSAQIVLKSFLRAPLDFRAHSGDTYNDRLIRAINCLLRYTPSSEGRLALLIAPTQKKTP